MVQSILETKSLVKRVVLVRKCLEEAEDVLQIVQHSLKVADESIA
jgi:hypothetical protein